jgi:hypothetical protein
MEVKKEIYEHKDGFGYKIYIDKKAVIIQPHKPAVPGLQYMTEDEANKLADMIVTKMSTIRTEEENIELQTLASKKKGTLTEEEKSRVGILISKGNPTLTVEEVESVKKKKSSTKKKITE